MCSARLDAFQNSLDRLCSVFVRLRRQYVQRHAHYDDYDEYDQYTACL